MAITQLPQSTIKLITGSQVITSVSSAVKELIENSLDAGASNIDVKLDNNGLDRIEVKDDGTGICPSNAVFMGLPHYTSKISAFSDIESLESYGFRGEALNALCQVGSVTVTTATNEDTTGMIYVLDKNGQVTSTKPTHKVKGTSIVVTYLFKNIPVRRQFCSNNKRAKEELRQVENVVKSLGVINPSVRFTLYHNKNMIWQKTAGTELRQGIVYVLGYTPARELQELNAEVPEVKIEALVPRVGCDISILSKGNPEWSMVFINKRRVQSKNVHKVICEYIIHSFGERQLQRKSPIFLVSFTLSPTRLDVNLEPNKTRVLVQDEDQLLDELRKMLTKYYGNPTAKEDAANMESPVKKRKLDVEETSLMSKHVEILSDKQDNSSSRKVEVITGQPAQNVQSKFPQNEVVLKRPLVQEKENMVEMIPENNPWIGNTVDQSMTAEKWSMGHVKDPGGNFLEGPAVFIPGASAAPIKENLQLPFGSTSSMNSLAIEKETVPSVAPTDHISTMERREFEKDFSFLKGADSPDLCAPVKSPPRVPNCSERFGPVISPPRPRNEKKCRKPLQLVPKDDYIDLSVSSQMGRKEFAGFTKFARDARPQIILENPGIAFTKVAVMLADKWKDLSSDLRDMYEEKARDHIIARKMQQSDDLFQPKLSFEQKEKSEQKNKSPRQKPMTDPSKSSKSHVFRRSNFPYRASMDIIKERTQPQNKKKPTEDNNTLIGVLQPSGGWVCLKGNDLSLISPCRLQEIVLTHRLLATYTLPLRPLSSPQRIEEKDLGADNWKLLLSFDRAVCDIGGRSMVLSSPIIVKNGFRIQLSESEENTVVLLTHVADTISFYGIKDLLETLLLAGTNGTNELSLCRPLRVVNHIKGEAVRICRQDPSMMERQVLEELLSYWKMHLSSTDHCLHSKPIWTQIHNINATR